jgi:uncharacterized protein YbaA (DUF1428 family)
MSKYIDGFVLPVPQENVEKYRAMSQKAGEIWKEYGALEYVEAVGDDLEISEMLSFKKISGAAEGETVIFAWIVYESREERDRINAAVMEDPRLKEDMEANKDVFDFKRMAYGGFKGIVSL